MDSYAAAVTSLIEGDATIDPRGRSSELNKPKKHRYTTPIPGAHETSSEEYAHTTPDQTKEPTQHEAMDAIKESMAKLNTKFKEPPPVVPQKSAFRGRPTFAHLESVAEETGSTGSKRASADMAQSITESVETVLYRPLEEDPGYEGSAGSSGSSGRQSGGSGRYSNGQGSYETPSTEHGTSLGSPLKDEFHPLKETGTVAELPAVVDEAGEHALRRHDAKLERRMQEPLIVQNVSESQMGVPEIETAELAGSGPPAPAVPVPGLAQRDRRHRSRKSKGRGLKMKQNPAVAAIDGMIDSLGSTSKPTKKQTASDHQARHFSRPFSPIESSTEPESVRRRPAARPKYYETIRDGVPILMHKKSGVWVEAVEGVDLTTANEDADQENVIPEQEAEEVRDIEVPDPRAAYPEYFQHDRERSSTGDSGRGHQSSDSGYGSSTMPVRARQTSTERWADGQAAMRQHDNRVCQQCNRPKDDRHQKPTDDNAHHMFPEDVCPYLYPSNSSKSEETHKSAWSGPDNVVGQSSHAVMPGTKPRFHAEPPWPPMRAAPVQRRSNVPEEIEAKIHLAAADVEEILYGGRMQPKRSMKLRELEEQIVL